MSVTARADWSRPSLQAWALGGLLVASFALGGSSRADVPQLLALWPVAALALICGLWTLRAEHVRGHRFLFALAAAMVALVSLQLLPLPPAIWHRFPGRGLIAAIDQAVGVVGQWRPMTMTPPETRGALVSLLVPGAVLVLGSQLTFRERTAMLAVVLTLGAGSGLLGLLQILGSSGSALYPYPVTNAGSAVGLLANRNHQALLLAMILPMLAAGAALAPRRWPLVRLGLFGAGLIVLPLVLITGSRMGLVAGALALLAVPLVGGLPRPAQGGKQAARWLILAAPALAAALVALTFVLDRAVAIARLVGQDPANDLRTQIWPTLLPMIAAMWPIGSGFGSFERVYQLHEPDALLSPVYMNHAHDDWLELLLEAGLPGALLLAVTLVAFARAGWRAARMPAGAPATVLRRLGLVVIALAAFGSATDYPLRVPIHAALLALAALWACAAPPDTLHETPEQGAK